jgi:hypothetical protein
MCVIMSDMHSGLSNADYTPLLSPAEVSTLLHIHVHIYYTYIALSNTFPGATYCSSTSQKCRLFGVYYCTMPCTVADNTSMLMIACFN